MHPLLRHRRTLLAVVATGTLVLAMYATRLRVSVHNEAMHSTDNPVRDAYARFERIFGSDRGLLVAVETEDPLSPESLGRIDVLTRALAAQPGVTGVRSLTNEAVPLVVGPLVVPDRVAGTAPAWRTREEIRSRFVAHPWLRGRLLSMDGRATSLVVETDVDADPVALRRAALAAEQPGFAIRVAGLGLVEADMARAIRHDQLWLVPTLFLVFALLLGILLRSWKGVILPMGVVLLTLAWTLGFYAMAGHELNTVTALLSPVVAILSIEVAVHLIKAHDEARAAGRTPAEAASDILRHLLVPCVLTTLTTVIGFASLFFTSIPAIRLFAVYASLGVVLAFALSMVVVPAALLRWPGPARTSTSSWTPPAGLLRRSGLTLAGAFALTALALLGLPRLVVDTNLLRILRPSAPVVEAAEFVDARLTGANALEVMVRRRDGAALEGPEDWATLRLLERFLASKPHVTHVFSPVDVLESIARQRRTDALAPAELARGLALLRPSMRAYLAPDGKTVRVTARVRSVGTTAAEELVREVGEFARSRAAWEVEPTGLFALTALDSNGLVSNQLKSLGLALVLILLFIGIQFRSPVLGLLAAVPNLLPIAAVYGIMGWLGIRLSTATAMISSVMLGLIMDSTILFVARWRREASIEAALRGTAVPIGASALILMTGFATGCLGSFPPTIYFSFLSALTLGLSAASALAVLPACLRLLERRRPRPEPAPDLAIEGRRV